MNRSLGFAFRGCPGLWSCRGLQPLRDPSSPSAPAASQALVGCLPLRAPAEPIKLLLPSLLPRGLWVCAVAQGFLRHLPNQDLPALPVLLFPSKVLGSISSTKVTPVFRIEPDAEHASPCPGMGRCGCAAEKPCLVSSVGIFYCSTSSSVFGKETLPVSGSFSPWRGVKVLNEG